MIRCEQPWSVTVEPAEKWKQERCGSNMQGFQGVHRRTVSHLQGSLRVHPGAAMLGEGRLQHSPETPNTVQPPNTFDPNHTDVQISSKRCTLRLHVEVNWKQIRRRETMEISVSVHMCLGATQDRNLQGGGADRSNTKWPREHVHTGDTVRT